MIVVAILAIAIALGYPSYREQVMKARRAEGMGELLELADRMERLYSNTGSYESASLGTADTDVYRATTEKGNYTLGITTANTTVFTITAAPNGKQADDKCGTFTLTSNGQKSAGGGADCWKI
jgi:type IV pilus assembly protein PilE